MSRLVTPAVVVHGGAGDLEAARYGEARAGCRAAAEAALAILAAGGAALDAVQAAVRVLEDDPAFNAGRGSALTREGTAECDASIMDGASLAAGAVGAVANCDRAIALARAVLDDGEHVLLVGEGAWRFARERGFAPVDPALLVTPRALARVAAERAARQAAAGGPTGIVDPGTVGACAIDRHGHVAAATSTGGMAFKRPGRLGDTPLIGSGTYADDQGGAASATGVGESIIRVTLTRAAVDAMRGGADAHGAAWATMDELSRRVGGEAGIICVDRDGRLGAALAGATMSWAAGRLDTAAIARVADGVTVERGGELDRLLR